MADNELKIKISATADTAAISKTSEALNDIKGSANSATDEVRRFGTGVDSASESTKRLSSSVDGSTSSLKHLAFGFVSLTATISSLGYMAKTADMMTLLEGRVSLVTTSLKEQVAVQKELFAISQTTRQGLEATTQLYTGLAGSMKAMGKSQAETLKMTETVNKAIIISGSSTQMASAATLQLGQAFASGVLRGDELNSIMENAKGLAQAIADGMGVPIGKLRELGSEGKITSEILAKALEKSADDIDNKFGKLPMTMGQAMVKVQNSTAIAIQEFDKLHGISSTLAESINSLSKGIDDGSISLDGMIDTVENVALAYGTYKGVMIATTVATEGATVATVALNAVARINPWVALATGIAGAVYYIREYSGLLDKIAKSQANVAGSQMFNKDSGVLKGITSKDQKRAYTERMLSDALKQDKVLVNEYNKSFFEASSKGFEGQSKSAIKAKMDAKKGEIDHLKKLLTNLSSDEAKAVNLDFKPKATFVPSAQKPNKASTKGVKSSVESEAEREAKRLQTLQDELNNALKKSNESLTLSTLDEYQKREEKARFSMSDSLEKFKGVKNSEVAINKIFSNEMQKINDDRIAKQEETALKEHEKDVLRLESVLDRIKSPLEKLNESTLSEFDLMSKMFGNEIPDAWFTSVNKQFEDLNQKVSGMDFSASIDFDTQSMSGTSKAIASIGKATDALSKAEKQYQKNKMITGATSEELAKNEKQYQSDQIIGYSNLAGAASQMFDQGSREAQAFATIQSGLAMINAVTGIAKQASLPFPYNIAAMAGTAATVFSFLKSAGISGGGGGVSVSTDAFSAQKANDGTGTVLGDDKAKSESIAKSLEILKDFAKPELAALNAMMYSLKSIDSKTKGIASGIVSRGGFSLGEGFKASSSQSMLSTIPVIGSLFGGGSTTTLKDSGISFNSQNLVSAIDNIQGNSYQTTQTDKKGGLFKKGSSSTSTTFGAIDEDTKDQFGLVLKDLYDVTLEGSKILGVNAKKSLDSMNVELGKISFLGKTGAQIQEELGAVFSKAGDQMAKASIPMIEKYKDIGEGLLETLTRVSVGFEVVSDTLGDINLHISGDTIDITQSLIDLSGSLSEFNNSTKAYYDNFFSDKEKMTDKKDDLLGIFTDLGLALPTTNAGFRQVVESLDLTTLGGQKAFNTLMQSADSFNQFGTAVEESTKKATDSILSVVNTFVSAFDDMRRATNDLIKTLSPASTGKEDQFNLLVNYHNLKKEFMTGFDSKGIAKADSIDKIKSDYDKITANITSLSSSGIDSNLKESLVGELQGFGAMFDKNDSIVKVAVVQGMLTVQEQAKALGLSEEQAKALQTSNGYSKDQTDKLYTIATTGSKEEMLGSVNEWVKRLYEAQKNADALDASSLTVNSFNAGHVFGTQEKIDFAKRTGLTIGSSGFNQAIADIQGFSTQSDDTGYLRGMVSANNVTSVSAIRSLGDLAPKDAQEALTTVKGEYTGVGAQIQAINRQNARETASQKYLFAIGMMSDFANGAFDGSSAHGTAAFAFLRSLGLPEDGNIRGNQGALTNFINVVNKKIDDEVNSINYSDQGVQDFSGLVGGQPDPMWGGFANLSGYSAEQMAEINRLTSAKTMLGFAVGTPNVPYDMTANIHRGEMIIPQTFSEGIRSGNTLVGDTSAIKEVVMELKEQNRILREQNRILTEQRDIQNESLIKLENIEAVA